MELAFEAYEFVEVLEIENSLNQYEGIAERGIFFTDSRFVFAI